VWEKTTRAVIQVKQPNFQAINRRIFTVYCCFYFFNIRTKKKVIQVLKKRNNEFLNNKNFFRICDIKKFETTLHSKYSPLYSVEI